MTNFEAIIQRLSEFHMEQMTGWEIDFINNMYDWHVFQEKSLTMAQKNKILSINRRVLSGGDY